MTIQKFHVPCLYNKHIATEIWEFALAKPEGFAFEAGQFVLFDVPTLDDPTDIQTRAFSIASSPDEEQLLFVAKILPDGRASLWITNGIKEGTTVSLQGPFGRFVLNTETKNDYLFVCTSTGNAPFRSQILHALHGGDKRRMDLIYGVRSKDRFFWVEEFEALADTYENFHLHLSLSDPHEDWSKYRGRVQAVAEEVVKDFSQKSIYICGHPDMTNDVKRLCLEEWGVQKSDLHVEGYI
ncbi:MAG: FAD-binding oxidoreductase [bacterium]|nr:FAD-binding oxidoreductase [bacterium]